MRLALAALALHVAAAPAAAAPCERAHEPAAGDVVPCDGVLLPASVVVELLDAREAQLPRCRRELAAERVLRTREVTALEAQLELERDRPPVVLEVTAPAPSTWSSPTVWIVGGVALIAGVVGGALAAR